MLAPARWVTDPRFHGLDLVPDRGPLLFVGNHTLFGLLDAPHMWLELYRRRGILLRSLGDHFHFRVPVWGPLLERYGVVDGTPANCARLMDQGASILVFPGGAREVTKRRGERYQLIWKDRLGFARLAIAHRCTIVPFAAVGVEHALHIVRDGDDLLASPLGGLLRRLGVREDFVPPLVAGVGPTALPRPQRLYFQFRPPVDPTSFGTDPADDHAVGALRDFVRGDIQEGIRWLRERRRRDPGRHLLPRILSRGRRATSALRRGVGEAGGPEL